MSDESVKVLLAKFKIDVSSWKTAVADIRSVLKQMVDEQIAMEKQLKAQKQTAAAEEKEQIKSQAQERVKAAAEEKARQAELAAQKKAQLQEEIVQRKAATEQALVDKAKEIGQAKLAFEQTKAQLAEQLALTKAQAKERVGYQAQAIEEQKALFTKMYENETLLVNKRYDAELKAIKTISGASGELYKQTQLQAEKEIDLQKSQAVFKARMAGLPTGNVSEIEQAKQQMLERQRLQRTEFEQTKLLKNEEILQAQKAADARKLQIMQDTNALKKEYEEGSISAKQYVEGVTKLNFDRYVNEVNLIKARTEATIKSYAVEQNEIKRTSLINQERMKQEIALSRLNQEQMMAAPVALPGAVGAAEGGGGLGRAALGGLARGGLTGLFGTVMGGTIVGQMVFDEIKSLKERLEEMGKAAGKEAQLMETLTQAMRGSPEDAEKFIAKLKGATMGLVETGKLQELATVMFRNNMHLTQDQMVEMAQNVMKLSVTLHGPEGATSAIHSLIRAYETGNARVISYQVGIQRLSLMNEEHTRGLSRAAAAHQSFIQMMDELKKRADSIPGPLLTLTMAQQQYRTATEDLGKEFDKMIVTSPPLIGLQRALTDTMTRFAEYLKANGPRIEKVIDQIATAISTFAFAIGKLMEVLLPAAGQAETLPAALGEAASGIVRAIAFVIERLGDLGLRLVQNPAVKIAAMASGTEAERAGLEKALQGITDFSEQTRAEAAKLQDAFGTVRTGLVDLGELGGTAAEKFSKALDEMVVNMRKSPEELAKAIKDFESATKERKIEILRGKGLLEAAPVHPTEAGFQFASRAYLATLGKTTPPPEEDKTGGASIQARRELEQERLKTKIEGIQEREKAEEQGSKQELEILEQRHKTGEVGEEEYNQRVLEIRADLMREQFKAARLEYQATLDNIKKQNEVPELQEKSRLAALDKYNKAKDAAQRAANEASLKQAFEQDTKDRAMRMQAVEDEKTDRMEQIKWEQQANEEAYKQGYILLADYTAAKKQALQDEIAALEVYYQKKEAEAGQDDVKRTGLLRQQFKEEDQLRRQEAALDADYEQKRREEVQKTLDFRMRMLEMELERQQTIAASRRKAPSAQLEIIPIQERAYQREQQVTVDNLGQLLKNFVADFSQMTIHVPGEVLPGGLTTPTPPTAIGKTIDQLNAALEKQIKLYNAHTIDYDDLSNAIRRFIEEMDTLPEAIKDTPAFRSLQEELQKAAGSLEKTGTEADSLDDVFAKFIGQLGDSLSMIPYVGQVGKDFKNLSAILSTNALQGTSVQGVIGGFSDMWRSFSGQGKGGTGKSLSSAFEDTVQSAGRLGGEVGNVIQAITNPPTPLAGAVGGAATGAALGKAVGGGLETISDKLVGTAGEAVGGVLQSVASIAGPIGGVVMGMVGLISGLMTQAARDIADHMKKSFDAVGVALEQGSLNLKDALAQEIAIRDETVQRLSGMKGGKQELQSLLPQFNQQIAQLYAQQRQVITGFEQQLAVLGTGTGFQSTASQIAQIIEQYQQYVAAGGSVATANQYLAESFQNLQMSIQQEYNTDLQSAIQNAIQYNQLLYQRQQLLDSTYQQQLNILNQGVLVRQTTVAQSKAYQLELLQQQTQQQLQGLNEQIEVSKYQLDTQQQIFHLASTQAGLEQQLAQVQMSVINYDMIRINALSSLLQQFQTGGGVPMGSFIAALLQILGQQVPGGPPQDVSALQQLANALGLPGPPGGNLPNYTLPTGQPWAPPPRGGTVSPPGVLPRVLSPGWAPGGGNPPQMYTPTPNNAGPSNIMTYILQSYYGQVGRYGNYIPPSYWRPGSPVSG